MGEGLTGDGVKGERRRRRRRRGESLPGVLEADQW